MKVIVQPKERYRSSGRENDAYTVVLFCVDMYRLRGLKRLQCCYKKDAPEAPTSALMLQVMYKCIGLITCPTKRC